MPLIRLSDAKREWVCAMSVREDDTTGGLNVERKRALRPDDGCSFQPV
jgi:hypothetical protein